jgi:hypothetical protein
MELTVEAEIYCPSIDENRNYVDKIPPSIVHGIRCPCGSRKNKVYVTATSFSEHLKCAHHQDWLKELNLNKVNHYRENEELKKTVHNQRMIISQLEKEVLAKLRAIDYLTQQLMAKTAAQTEVANLLDI